MKKWHIAVLVALLLCIPAVIVGGIAYSRMLTTNAIIDALDLHDRDFLAEVDSTGDGGLVSMAVYGTLLENEDFELRSIWARDGEISEEVKASSDGDFVYVDTRALTAVLMPESADIIDGFDYIKALYDEMFGMPVTAFPLTGNEQFEESVSVFKELSSILYKNTVNAAVRYGSVKTTDDGITLDFDARAAVKFLEAVKSELDKDSGKLADAILRYSLLDDAVIAESSFQAELRESIDKTMDDLIARASENDTKVHVQIQPDGSAYIEIASYDAACNIALTSWKSGRITLEHPTGYDTYHHQIDVASMYFDKANIF